MKRSIKSFPIFPCLLSGYFWHITDLHFDSFYTTKGDTMRSEYNPINCNGLSIRGMRRAGDINQHIHRTMIHTPPQLCYNPSFTCCWIMILHHNIYYVSPQQVVILVTGRRAIRHVPAVSGTTTVIVRGH